MYNFCPHCGKPVGQEQLPGKTTNCKHCGKPIGPAVQAQTLGVVHTQRAPVQQAAQLMQSGAAAQCPYCNQLVELKGSGPQKSYVPHFTTGSPRKMCRNSGKPLV